MVISSRVIILVQAVFGSLGLVQATNLTHLFGPGLSPKAQIVLPGSSEWTAKTRQRWTTYHAPSLTGAIKPATVADIQHIVKVAAAHHIPFLATGGGHGVSDYRPFEGISIDLGNFKSVHLDVDTNILTVSAATEYSQLHKLLYDAGKELPLASCACVGVIGATLGGGVSQLQGHRGLMLDALESVQIVTASGDLVTASKTSNPDLFWAIRGAGANFGIVVQAKYRVYDFTNNGQAMVADLVFPAAANQSYFRALAALGSDNHDNNKMPTNLGITAVGVYNRDINQPVLVIHAVYFGPRDEGEKYLEPFVKMGPLVRNIVTVPQTDLFPPDHGSCEPNQRINVYTLALKQIHTATFEAFYGNMVDLWQRFPDYDGRLLIERYPGGKVAAVPREETAYPWRDAVALMNIESFYVDKSHDDVIDRVAAAGRDEFAKTSGFDRLSTYVNFAHGDEGPEAWYGASLPRLVQLKRKWDPRGLFSWHNPIPLDSSPSDL